MKPNRPFEADYPAGAKTDAAGRLTHDIDGRPLVAEHVVGRAMGGAVDQALPKERLYPISARLIGEGHKVVPPGALPRGAVGAYRVTPTPDRLERRILVSDELSPKQQPRVVAHEMGHMLDDLAGTIDQTGVKRQLGQVYHDLNDPTWRRGQPTRPGLQTTPEQFGYRGAAMAPEYTAEAMRAYMTDPNYLKTVAPETAARIRAQVNSHPELSKVIQFNANPEEAALPGLLTTGQEKPTQAAIKVGGAIRGYHGNTGQGLANDIYWGSSSRDVAKAYTQDSTGRWKTQPVGSPYVQEAEFRFEKPKVVDAQGRRYDNLPGGEPHVDFAALDARDAGHDGLIIKNVIDPPMHGTAPVADTYAALQRGTVYDPKTGNLLWSNPEEAALPGLLRPAKGEQQLDTSTIRRLMRALSGE